MAAAWPEELKMGCGSTKAVHVRAQQAASNCLLLSMTYTAYNKTEPK